VQKSTGKLYWYGMGSDPLDESDASGNLTDEYVFFGGKRIARRNVSSGNIFYYFGCTLVHKYCPLSRILRHGR